MVARYRSFRDARAAIEQLESRGIDGDDLALVGDTAQQAAHAEDRTRADRRFLRTTSGALAVGVAAGAVIGALIGAVFIGVILAVWTPATHAAWIFGLLTGWFAAGGAVFGAFVAVSKRIGFSESWPLTFEDEPEAPIWLAIYADGDELRTALEATSAAEIVDESGVEAALTGADAERQ